MSLRTRVGLLRRTPPRRWIAASARVARRAIQARLRRLGWPYPHGELSDRLLLRAFGGRFATPIDVVEHVRARLSPHFFVTPAQTWTLAAALAKARPDLAERTRYSAGAVLQHRISALAPEPVDLGPRIDWHRDYVTGYRWPLRFHEDIDYLGLDHTGDVRRAWELNRCHHWVTLGRAYALTGDESYAVEFVEQLHSWLDANPWPLGIAWGNAMEAAIRTVNWWWAATLFDSAVAFDARARVRLLKSLVQHGRHIAANLEESENSGNHLVANAVGLAFLGILLPECTEASSWRHRGLAILWREIERQVYPDGVTFEKGIGYQGLVLELWYSVLRLCEINAIAVPSPVRERLDRMFAFTVAYTRPDGTYPRVGDDDDSRLAGLDDEPPGSHGRHLAVGGVLLHRPELLAGAHGAVQTAVWLCGLAALEAPGSGPALVSQGFVDGGFYVMRTPEAMLLIDAGEVGLRGQGGHGHNDLLSFDLWAGGTPLIVDPGTYSYTGDTPARQWFRSTAAHNVVRVDGEEMARLGDGERLWWIADDARPRVLAWCSEAEMDVLEAEHTGYERLSRPVQVRRCIEFHKPSRHWLVRDTLEGSGRRLVESFLHLGTSDFTRHGEVVVVHAQRADLWIVPRWNESLLRLVIEEGWVSTAYGRRERMPVLVYRGNAALPLRLGMLLVLTEHGASLREVQERIVTLGFGDRPLGSVA